MATRTPATHSHSWLLVIAGILVATGAIGRALLLRREPGAKNQSPRPSHTATALLPDLARDPFVSTPAKPPALVAPRPSVRGEAALLLVAIGAYVAAAAVSFIGGNGTPDLLNVRGGSTNVAGQTAAVLSAQATPDASAEILIETSTPAPAVSVPAPTEVPAPEPTPEPEPEPPAQHILRTGETLTSVAALYGVTVYELTTANALGSDRVLAGQVLKIPPK